MLSSPDAKGSNGERFGLGQQPIGGEAQHDLVFARTREPINGATSERRYQGGKATAERSRAEPAF